MSAPSLIDVAHDPGRLAGRHRLGDRRGVLPALLDLEGLPRIEHPLRLGVLVEVAGHPVEVLADRDVEALDGVAGGVLLADEPGVVLAVVLGRLGQVVAEPAEQVRADEVVVGGPAGLDEPAQVRVEIPAAVFEPEQEGVVVDAGRFAVDLVARDAQVAGQRVDRPEDRVAEAHDLDRARLGDRPDDDRQRVRVVEEPGVGAHLGHVAGDAEHDGHGPKAAEHAADADRVGDGVAEPEAGGDLEVDLGRPGAAHLDRVDDEVGTLEGRPPIEMGRDGRARR